MWQFRRSDTQGHRCVTPCGKALTTLPLLKFQAICTNSRQDFQPLLRNRLYRFTARMAELPTAPIITV